MADLVGVGVAMGVYYFGPFRLDEEARRLSHLGEPVPLTAKVFDTLSVLVRNHGRVLDKEELLSAIWPGTAVEEANLTQNVFTLRKVLGDNAKDGRYIATIPGRGYSFVARVSDLPGQEFQPRLAEATASSLVVPTRRRSGISTVLPWLTILFSISALAVWVGPRLAFRNSNSPDRIDSLAVLPFANLSNDPGQEFFVAGITEQLITDLSKIRSLRVISRTSAMQYRPPIKKGPAEIARELGVAAIVEGSVLRSGGKVRISARLIQARGDHYLWGETYERELGDVLDLQRDVAEAIANQIRATAGHPGRSQTVARRPVDPAVNDLVLKGKYHADQFSQASLKQAIGYFEQAISIDSNYAPAHAALGCVYRSGALLDLSPREMMPKLKVEAEKALQLDETLDDAHVCLAYALIYYDWDWPEAEKHLRRALELNPSSADAHLVYSGYLTSLGRTQEALAEIRVAQALDPLSLPVQRMLLFCLVVARQYDQAIAQFHRTVESEPNFARAYLVAALAYAEKGQMEQALAAAKKADQMENSATTKAVAAHVHAANGDRDRAEKLLEELRAHSKLHYVCAYELAHAYLKLGDRKRAYEWLEKGKRERADCMVNLLVEPWMDPLRQDGQYKELINHIGLATGKSGPKP
jgi:TolB-like protein/DNA-binding winged helix-turn-helix (wHTH) protein/Tfp pilus assembly protein PilF